MASETYECQTYEYRETIYGRASRGRLRTMYHEDGSLTAETVGVAHTPHGTVEVHAAIWRDGIQMILLYTVRDGVLYQRWERRRRPLTERGLTTLARRWAQSMAATDTEVSDGE